MNLRYMLMNEVGLLAAGHIANMNARIQFHGQTGENVFIADLTNLVQLRAFQ